MNIHSGEKNEYLYIYKKQQGETLIFNDHPSHFIVFIHIESCKENQQRCLCACM